MAKKVLDFIDLRDIITFKRGTQMKLCRARKGKPLSEEHKSKLSQARQRYLQNVISS